MHPVVIGRSVDVRAGLATATIRWGDRVIGAYDRRRGQHQTVHNLDHLAAAMGMRWSTAVISDLAGTKCRSGRRVTATGCWALTWRRPDAYQDHHNSSPDAKLAHLTRVLKAPTMSKAITRLVERARGEGWTQEQLLAACLEQEVTARATYDGGLRAKAAQFPTRKPLEDFDFAHATAVNVNQVATWGRSVASTRKTT